MRICAARCGGRGGLRVGGMRGFCPFLRFFKFN